MGSMLLARVLLCTCGLLSVAAASPQQPPPGEGVLCTMALVEVSAEAGRRCHAGQHPEFQAMLERSEVKLDAYFTRNGPATPQQLAHFKRQQAGIGEPDFKCLPADEIYLVMLKNAPGSFERDIDELLSRPGKPTFGDCL